MTVRATSRASYQKIKHKMGDKQRELYEALKEIEPASDRDLAIKLDWSISHITPRRGELVKYGFIVESGRKFDVETGRRVMAWATADPIAQRHIEKAVGKTKPAPVAEEPEPAKPEAVREALLVKQGDQWVETNDIPVTLRRNETEYRTQRIGVDTGKVYSDMLTYWEDGYESNRQMVQ